MDRIELNGQIERLIDSDGHDEEARRAIVDFGLSIQGSSSFQFKGLYQKPGGTVSGQTPQHGQVEVKDEHPETREFSSGSVLERVGYYKIWRQREWIHIAHFWKSEIETSSETEMARQWVLALDHSNQPEWFGERGVKHLFTLRLTKILRIEFSREMFEERWGPTVKRQHKGAIAIAVTISA